MKNELFTVAGGQKIKREEKVISKLREKNAITMQLSLLEFT